MKNLAEYYRLMLTIRIFEETVEDLFAQGKIGGTTHPAAGQEATEVGACAALEPGDFVTSTHRGHGHMIARGGDPNRIMAELFGKVTGYSRGRGGSQLMVDLPMGFLGSNGITGGGIPIATGAALSSQMRKTGRVALCFFGDGASNQGTFHESLNMAGLWKLPVVYLCENNLYAMSTPVAESMPVPDIAVRAAAYAMPGRVVDGNDVLTVRDAVAEACARARSGGGPTLLECKTYRFSGHSRGDPRKYRTREEEATWREKDPLLRTKGELKRLAKWTEKDDRALRSAVKKAVAEAVKFARSSPYPDPATLEQGVWA
jgi:TPP-dependent pyruvate/acetoin dehydrogenase alpha subunit